jgi:hypothetical protein
VLGEVGGEVLALGGRLRVPVAALAESRAGGLTRLL